MCTFGWQNQILAIDVGGSHITKNYGAVTYRPIFFMRAQHVMSYHLI